MKILFALMMITSCASKKDITVVAHRGASGYLPEHTLESMVLAHSWNVDYIELDTVMTKDNRIVILHDHHIDTTTNVATIFPRRKRSDGRYYAVDFTLKELKKLSVHERVDLSTKKQVFPKRFPLSQSSFKIPTLEEAIELVQGLNQTRSQNIGLYIEIKKPEFHLKNKKDLTAKLLSVLDKYELKTQEQIIIQCFFPPTLKRIRKELKSSHKLVLLLADPSWNESSADYYTLLTKAGIQQISDYADGIGPWIPQIKKNPLLVKWAHDNGMVVHPYTHRSDALPKDHPRDEQFFDQLFEVWQVDGLFSDFANKLMDYKYARKIQ